MAYTDPQTIHNPSTGGVPPASWGDAVRDCVEFLVDPPACSVYASAAQSVATGAGAGVVLTADAEAFDNDSMHSTVSSTGRITATTAGRYLFVATVQFAVSATGNRRLAFRVNGTTTYESTLVAGTTTNSIVLTAPRLFSLAAADYVEVMVWQTSGGNLDVTLLEFGATFLTR